MSGSAMFAPFSQAGLFSGSAPAHVKKLGKEHFATVVVGRSWKVYNCDKLRTVMLSPAQSKDIRYVVSVREYTFTTCGHHINVWHRSSLVCTLKAHRTDVYMLHLFGNFLFSVSEDQSVCMWNLMKVYEYVRAVRSLAVGSQSGVAFADVRPAKSPKFSSRKALVAQFSFNAGHIDSKTSGEDANSEQSLGRRVTVIHHPPTYINKLLIGFDSGELELWNVRSKRCIYAFPVTQKWSTDGVASAITCLTAAPRRDCCAVGTAAGEIMLVNLRSAQVLFQCRHTFTPETKDSTYGSLADRLNLSSHSKASTSLDKQDSVSSATTKRIQLTADSCVGVAFRPTVPVMLTASACGHVCAWHIAGGDSADDSGSDSEDSSDEKALDVDNGGLISVRKFVHSPPRSGLYLWRNAFSTFQLLPGTDWLLTGGGYDNALAMYEFASPHPGGFVGSMQDIYGKLVQLRRRAGHSGAVQRLRFMRGLGSGVGGSQRGGVLVSCGADGMVRHVNVWRERQGVEYSQGHVASAFRSRADGDNSLIAPPANLRLSPATHLAVPSGQAPVHRSSRAHEFASFVTCHEGDAAVYMWSYENKRLCKRKLVRVAETGPEQVSSTFAYIQQLQNADGQPTDGRVRKMSGGIDGTFTGEGKSTTAAATCATMSRCGHFVVVGYSDGVIMKFSAESGLFRARFGAKLKAGQSTTSSAPDTLLASGEPAGVSHVGRVTACIVDVANKSVITTGTDGTIRFWDLERGHLQQVLVLPNAVTAARLCRVNGLLACVGADLVVRVVDIERARLVRKLAAASSDEQGDKRYLNAPVSAMSWGSDGAVLLVASVNGDLLCFDVRSGACVDWVHFSRPIVDMDVGPNGNMLATCHRGSLAVCVWINRSKYQKVFLKRHPRRPVELLDGACSAALVSIDQSTAAKPTQPSDDSSSASSTGSSSGTSSDDSSSGSSGSSSSSEHSSSSDGSDSQSADRFSDIQVQSGSDVAGWSRRLDLPEDRLSWVHHFLVDGPQDQDQDSWHKQFEAVARPGQSIAVSGLPKSRWAHLAQLEAIRERNRPREQKLNKPQAAPFFLSAAGAGDSSTAAPAFDVDNWMAEQAAAEDSKQSEQRSRRRTTSGLAGRKRGSGARANAAWEDQELKGLSLSQCLDLWWQHTTTPGLSRPFPLQCLLRFLLLTPPNALSAEVLSLSFGGSLAEDARYLALMLCFFCAAFSLPTGESGDAHAQKARKVAGGDVHSARKGKSVPVMYQHFEVLESVMNLFLRTHASSLVAMTAKSADGAESTGPFSAGHVRRLLEAVKIAHGNAWSRLRRSFDFSQCSLQMLGGLPL